MKKATATSHGRSRLEAAEGADEAGPDEDGPDEDGSEEDGGAIIGRLGS